MEKVKNRFDLEKNSRKNLLIFGFCTFNKNASPATKARLAL